MTQPPAACWTLTDGRAGNLRQARALAAAMGFADARDIALRPRAPWRWGAPRALPGSDHAFEGFAPLLDAPPSLAIGCGRQAALATRRLRERGARVVQILDPRIDPARWDVVVVPEHDRVRGDNVVTLLGSLNPVDDLWLAQAREDFSILAELPRPRTTLLLGGPHQMMPYYDLAYLTADLKRIADRVREEQGCLLATTSRRTPTDCAQALRDTCGDIPGLRWFASSVAAGGNGDNPYSGMLAWADRIVCSFDSVNMVSEACATRAPVFTLGMAGAEARLESFAMALEATGRVREFHDRFETYDFEPLRETARVAAEVRNRLGL